MSLVAPAVAREANNNGKRAQRIYLLELYASLRPQFSGSELWKELAAAYGKRYPSNTNNLERDIALYRTKIDSYLELFRQHTTDNDKSCPPYLIEAINRLGLHTTTTTSSREQAVFASPSMPHVATTVPPPIIPPLQAKAPVFMAPHPHPMPKHQHHHLHPLGGGPRLTGTPMTGSPFPPRPRVAIPGSSVGAPAVPLSDRVAELMPSISSAIQDHIGITAPGNLGASPNPKKRGRTETELGEENGIELLLAVRHLSRVLAEKMEVDKQMLAFYKHSQESFTIDKALHQNKLQQIREETESKRLLWLNKMENTRAESQARIRAIQAESEARIEQIRKNKDTTDEE